MQTTSKHCQLRSISTVCKCQCEMSTSKEREGGWIILMSSHFCCHSTSAYQRALQDFIILRRGTPIVRRQVTGMKRKQQFVGTFLDIYLKYSLEVVIIFVEGGFICSCLLGNVCLRIRNSFTSNVSLAQVFFSALPQKLRAPAASLIVRMLFRRRFPW